MISEVLRSYFRVIKFRLLLLVVLVMVYAKGMCP